MIDQQIKEANQSMFADKQSVIRRRRKKLSIAEKSEICLGTCTSKSNFNVIL
jgi:hypothetical protein